VGETQIKGADGDSESVGVVLAVALLPTGAGAALAFTINMRGAALVALAPVRALVAAGVGVADGVGVGGFDIDMGCVLVRSWWVLVGRVAGEEREEMASKEQRSLDEGATEHSQRSPLTESPLEHQTREQCLGGGGFRRRNGHEWLVLFFENLLLRGNGVAILCWARSTCIPHSGQPLAPENL
jgi:hypothetical protein